MIRSLRRWCRRVPSSALLAVSLTALFAGPVSGAPRVAVSIAPVHSLVAGVMKGVAEPSLIVHGYGSPHAYQMRPSEARALEAAHLVFWVGPSMETFLVRHLASVEGRARVVALMNARGLRLLRNRSGGVWNAQHGEGASHSDEHGDTVGEHDSHIWLSPGNAVVLVSAIAGELVQVDPDNESRYEANARALRTRIDRMARGMEGRLEPVRREPFLVFHDAYQYFEDYFRLRGVGSLMVSPERLPSARRLTALRKRIEQLGVRCVFHEPQFRPALVETLVEGTGARVGVLDPMGAPDTIGEDAYFRLMEGNADSLLECLQRI